MVSYGEKKLIAITPGKCEWILLPPEVDVAIRFNKIISAMPELVSYDILGGFQ